MTAPPLEVVLRLGTSMMAWGALSALLYARRHGRTKPSSLLDFLSFIVFLIAVWRTIVLWLGFQSSIAHTELLVWVQPINSALLFLFLFAVALIALHHPRHPPAGS